MKHLARQLDRLRACFARMPDPRRGRGRRYAMADIGMAALSVFFMQSPSFLAHQRALTEAYEHDQKARLHERLPELAEAIARRTKLKNVTLDSFIVSATPHEDPRMRYDDGSWDRTRFAEKHVLFPERGEDYDYLVYVMAPPDAERRSSRG